jgi:hypothetical protein
MQFFLAESNELSEPLQIEKRNVLSESSNIRIILKENMCVKK